MSAGNPDASGPQPDGSRLSRENAIAKAFIEERLGAHSSHPALAHRRLAFWRWIGVAVSGVVISYAVTAVTRSLFSGESVIGGVLGGLRQVIAATDFILFALAVSLAGTLSAALTIRVSRLGKESSHRPFGRVVLGTALVVLVAVVFASAVGFGWLATTYQPETIARNRWWVALGAALPLEALLIYTEVRERRRDPSSFAWLLAALRQVWFAASIAAVVMVMTPSVSRWVNGGLVDWMANPTGILGTLFRNIPGHDLLANGIVARGIGRFLTMTVGLAAAMVTVTWVTTRVAMIAGDDCAATAPSVSRPGWLSRMLGFLSPFRWFGRRSEAEESDGGDSDSGASGGPGWVLSLAGTLKEIAKGPAKAVCVPAIDPETFRASRDHAPTSADSHLEILFNGRAPTEDQVAALRMIDECWFRHSLSLQANAFGPASQSHADILVQAFPESFDDPEDDGVLELQVAASMLAVIARGQRVVFLVPGEDERSRVRDAVQARLEALRVETLYRVGSLAPSEISTWAPPAAAPGTVMEERPPDVLVATLGDYEQAFFGGANSAHVVRPLLFDAEVVMLPNLLTLSMSREGRLHLPFILDKHRLILASENRSMQLVVGTPPIGERPVAGRNPASDADDAVSAEVQVALESIALRFFGGDAKLEGHSAVLRRRTKSFPQSVVVRVPAATLDACLDAVAVHVARAEGIERTCVVLGREDPRDRPERAAARSVGKKRVTVLHELDFESVSALADRAKDFAFVVLQARSGGRLVRELGSRLDPKGATIVQVTAGAPVIRLPTPTWSLRLPVFPSADSPALALAHLRSGAFQLGADSLIRRDEFVRFGIGWSRNRWSAGGGFEALHEGWAIELDGKAAVRLSATDDQGEIWPAAIVRSDVRKERPVLLTVPPERGLGLAGEEVISLAQDGFPADPSRTACWMGPRGQVLGRVDLAYASRFVWEGDRMDYRAVSVERSEEQGWVIHGHPFHGGDDEPELPAVQVLVDLPASAKGVPIQVRQGESLRVFSVRDRGGAERCMSRERIVGLVPRSHASAGRPGAIDPSLVTPIGPLEYSLRVGMSFVCMGSKEWLANLEAPSADDVRKAPLPEWLCGAWPVGGEASSERVYSPSFTAALQSSIHAIAPGILEFARIAAFRLANLEQGVVIAFIEPHATVGTAAEAMRVVLDDPELRKRFVGRLLEAVTDGGDKELPAAPLFIVGLDKQQDAADRDWTRRLITAIPGSVIEVGAPISTIVRDRQAPLEERPVFEPSEVSAEGGVHRWKWRTEGAEVSLSVEIGVEQREADAATLGFGISPDERDHDRIRRGGLRILEGNRITPDYGWMVRRSEEPLKPLAERLLAVAQQAGAGSLRDRVEVFASFVQSLRYQSDAEGRINDGKLRLGVQMPQETLFTGRGDCDSLTVLLLGLVRAAQLADGCVVLVDEHDGGHAMAAIEIEPRCKKDWSISVRSRGSSDQVRTFTLVETTAAGWRLGHVASEYHGRYVRIDALRDGNVRSS